MSKFTISECSDLDKWDNFVEESPQGTIYSSSDFILSIYPNSKLFLVENAHEVLGGVSLLIDHEQNLVKAPSYFPFFNSILFKPNRGVLNHKKIKQEFNITELILNEIISEFKEFSCAQTPAFNDIRPFEWYNFDHKSKGFFKSNINYTAILNLKDKSKT